MSTSTVLKIRNMTRTQAPEELTEPLSTFGDGPGILLSDLLRESVISAAKNVLGETLACRILSYLRLDTAANMLEVGTLLHSMCGDFGASIVERAIVKELFQRLNIKYEERYGLDFEGSIQLILKILDEGTLLPNETAIFGSGKVYG
ncbi:MAG: hypothetical protein HYU02_08060 [Thaumarchaeota archaeon]|nr:hypothetical protein [Nitrososphaerota archaeon]